MNVGERIRYFRQNKNITVNKLANMAGISQSYLRDLELGNKQPTVEYLNYICDALSVSMAYFFSDEEKDNELGQLIDKLSVEQKDALVVFLKTVVK